MKRRERNWRWRALAAVPWALLLSAVTCWWVAAPEPGPAPASGTPEGHPAPLATPPLPTDPDAPASAPLPPSATAAATGESHSLAMSDIVERTKTNAPITPADIQALLAFISSPKPGDLTAGEWEERVNGILNLLRRQTEDYETEDRRLEGASRKTQDRKTQDAREKGASSLAGSGPASQGAAGPPRPTVPGLTEVLVGMIAMEN